MRPMNQHRGVPASLVLHLVKLGGLKRDRFEKEWSKSIQSAVPTFTITQLDSIF